MDNNKQIIRFEDIFKDEPKKKEDKKEEPNKKGYIFSLLYYVVVMYLIASIFYVIVMNIPGFFESYTKDEIVFKVIQDDQAGLALVEEDIYQQYGDLYLEDVVGIESYMGFVVLVNRDNPSYSNLLYTVDPLSGEYILSIIVLEDIIDQDPVNTTWDGKTPISIYKEKDQFVPPTFFSNNYYTVEGPQDIMDPIVLSIVNFAVYLVLIPGVLYFLKPDLKMDLSEIKPKKNELFLAIIIGYAYIWIGNIVSSYGSNFLSQLFNMQIDEAVNQEIIISAVRSSGAILMIVSAVFIGPVVEELIFRKALFGLIKKDSLALIASTVIFGLIHVIGESSIQAALINGLSYFVMGFVFGLIYLKNKRNIVVPILVHILSNAISILAILFLF
ncbi:MAG: CPBP family intramembrane metalloprotease [Acholeplasma sp.]|jgi:membrane protease YdiL (CAAX protease family)|nr:MAG: CPBP family intramembrane metalloprotease [Acholeplasma sp.]